MKFMLDKMAGGLEFCPSTPVSPVSITSPMLHTHTDYYEKDERAKPGNIQKQEELFRISTDTGQKRASMLFFSLESAKVFTRDVPKVMSNFFLHANWEQQTKESAVVDGTSCCVILECLETSIACIM